MNKLGKFELDKIYLGDCRDLTKYLPNNSIDMCITSPPYWGLRDYGTQGVIWDGKENCKHKWIHTIIPPKHKDNGKTKSTLAGTKTQEQTQRTPTEFDFCSKCGAWKGQLGLEPDFNLYIKHLCDIFDEVKRVLKKEGTCWVNMGDTYGGSGSASGHTEYTKNLGYITSKMGATKGHTKSLMPKCLIMIPFRFAIEMCKRRGFIIQDEKDRAWLAGIIEGEGCIHIHKRHRGRKNATYGNFLSIHNTNKKMIDRVIQLTGMDGNVQITKGKDRKHKLYRWNAMSNNAKKILREVYPYLVTKRNQARCSIFCPSSGKDAEECWKNIKKMHNYEKPSRDYPEPAVGGIDPWILRNVIIWKKPNCMPSSAKDRFTVDFEYLFFFSKSKRYYFEQQFEQHTSVPFGNKDKGYAKTKKLKSSAGVISGRAGSGLQGRNKRAVWKIGSKYTEAEGHSNRAGLQRDPTLREKRINEIIQKKIANYLRKYLTNEKRKILDKVFGKHKWPHWIRTDESGASLPSPNDWIKLKEILNFDNKHDDIMTETEIYLDDGMMWINKGKNKRTIWSITTKGFKEAHFAIFPEELIETPIKAGCPEFVCKKCGKAREKIYKIIKHKLIEDYKGQALKDYASAKAQNPSDTKRRILEGMTKEQKEVGHTNCECNAGFEAGIVLDPFIGSGTTGLVTIKQRKHFIGFEINPEYIVIAKKRLSNIQVRML